MCSKVKMNKLYFPLLYAFFLCSCTNTRLVKDAQRVSIALKVNQLDYPVFIDQYATFVHQNPNLPKNQQLHSFLLDKNNRVVLVGNPLYNPALWALYKRTIQEMIDNDGVLPEK